INIERGSDCNDVRGNRLSSTGAGARYARQYPSMSSGGALDIGVILGDPPQHPLYNLQIGERLVQVTNMGLHMVGNRIENNHLTQIKAADNLDKKDAKNHGGVALTTPTFCSQTRNNLIEGGAAHPGIRLNNVIGSIAFTIRYPRRCNDDKTRF